jgi:hypothetical protein
MMQGRVELALESDFLLDLVKMTTSSQFASLLKRNMLNKQLFQDTTGVTEEQHELT